MRIGHHKEIRKLTFRTIRSDEGLTLETSVFESLHTLANRPFAGSGHMVQNKLHWNANNAVGLSKQREVGLDW